MRFATINHVNEQVPVVQGEDGLVRPLRDVAASASLEPIHSILHLVQMAETDSGVLQRLFDRARKTRGFPAEGLSWAPPLPSPGKILGVAFNNKVLMEKAHSDPGVPNFFLKPSSCLQAHNKPIIVDPAWGAVIPEPEVCAVIGRRAKHIGEEDVLEHIFGYLIHNDVTSHGLKFRKDSIAVTYDRDLARPEFYSWRRLRSDDDRDVFFVYHTRSKGTDTFGPMGPWITTRDEIEDPNRLHVTGRLNEEVFTCDHTGNYRFTIQECVAEASRYFTLEPGDLISFGTTGKGAGRFPRGHKSLLIGQETGVISIEIQSLGRLSNPILHQPGGA